MTQQPSRAEAVDRDDVLAEWIRGLADAFARATGVHAPRTRFDHSEEAKALVSFLLTQGTIGHIHSRQNGQRLRSDPTLSRIADRDMQAIISMGTRKLAVLLNMRAEDPASYHAFVAGIRKTYGDRWERDMIDAPHSRTAEA